MEKYVPNCEGYQAPKFGVPSLGDWESGVEKLVQECSDGQKAMEEQSRIDPKTLRLAIDFIPS